ncbi:MAG: hypothetical protein CMN76_04020 [Spirochaetaceae bacterium]|nr:hypothetical protein [Spirochaetaceae bacterium]|tara:strand:+ start:267569 stop:269416 length:1848 start_codon:yes stop_codon:yes gene_type:complete
MINGMKPEARAWIFLTCMMLAAPGWAQEPYDFADDGHCTIDASLGEAVLRCARFRFFPASRGAPQTAEDFLMIIDEPGWKLRSDSQWRFPADPDVLWVHFIIRNASETVIPRFLINEFAFADSLILTELYQGNLKRQEQGLAQSWANKALDYRLPVFAMELRPGTTSFLLRLEARSGKLLSLKLEKPGKAASRESLPGYLFPAFLTGAIVALILSLFIAIIFKERTGLLYCIYVCLITVYLASWEGYSRQVFFPDHGTWSLSLLTFAGALAGWSVIALWRELLILSVHAPLVDTTMKWIGRAYVMAALYSLYPDASFPVLDIAVYILPALFIPLAIYSGVFVIRVGFRPALFSLVGFAGFLLTIPFFFYAGMGFIPGNDLTRNPLYLGYFFEFTFFLISVGVRIHFLKNLEGERAKRLTAGSNTGSLADTTGRKTEKMENPVQSMNPPEVPEVEVEEAATISPVQTSNGILDQSGHIQLKALPKDSKPVSRLRRLNISQLSRKLDLLMEEERLFCDEDLSQERLAELLGISRHQFSELLRVVYGTNFYAFLNRYRIGYARESLLADPERSVLSIALSAGFNSKSTFNAEFKKQTGMTPVQYRNQATEKPAEVQSR